MLVAKALDTVGEGIQCPRVALSACRCIEVLRSLQVSVQRTPFFCKELADASRSLRVLFLVPIVVEERTEQHLERLTPSYSNKPFRLHDLLDEISDLLLQAGIAGRPLRRVCELAQPGFCFADPQDSAGRAQEMFTSRDVYYDYDEQQLGRFEE